MRGELQAKLKKARVVKKRETVIFIDITAKPLRIEFPGALCHITFRGNVNWCA